MSTLKVKFSKFCIYIFILSGSIAFNSLYAQDWANLEKFKEENSKVDIENIDEGRVVFMGNSITIGWSHHYPQFFEKKPYINRGISGQTTPQMLVRFRADVVDLKPAVVVILAGTNDIAGNTGPSTLQMMADNIFSMAEIARTNNIKVIISSVLPAYKYPWKPDLEPAEKIVELNKLLKAYAINNGHIYLDYFSEMVNDQNGLIDDYGYDGVHPNETGYIVMSALAEEAISKALDK